MFFIIAQSFVPLGEYIKKNLIINLYGRVIDDIDIDIEIGIKENYLIIKECYSTQEELDELV